MATTTTTHILVLGATGRVGHHVVAELLARLSSGGYPPVVIHAATRDPSSGTYLCIRSTNVNEK